MTPTDAHHENVLVLGGTGKTGRRVAAGLRARGRNVRIGSRAGEPPFLWEDRTTWPKALDGATAAYIAYSPDLAAPEGADDVGVGEPFVDADDIAEVAVTAFTEGGHVGRLYEVTGPRLLTFGEAVAEIARAAGREIRYTYLPVDRYAAALAADGVPEEVVGLLTALFSEVLDGRNAHLSDGVRQALGRGPRDFSAYARTTAAAGIWTCRVQGLS